MPEIEDKLTNARSQGQAQFDSIKEMVKAFQATEKDNYVGDESEAREQAERAIPTKMR